jgi:large subunit ribosomal protein L19e
MNLNKRKMLAAKTLNVGKSRILFNTERLDEIKEAITKQDIKELFSSGAIKIKEVKGRKTIRKRKTRRRAGSIKKKIRHSKRQYIIMIRKLRAYLAELRKKEQISEEQYQKLRKEIRAKLYDDKSHLKEKIASMKK